MVVLGHVADFSDGGTPECDGRAVDAFLDLFGATSAESPESLAAHIADDLSVVLVRVADFLDGGTPEHGGRAVDAFLDLVCTTSAESPESLATHVDDLPDGGTPELDVGLGFVEITVCSEVRAGSHACTMHSPSSAG